MSGATADRAGQELAAKDHAPGQTAPLDRRRFVVALAVVAVVVPAVLAGAKGSQWWTWIAPEMTPMTWVQSVVLVLAASASALLWFLARRPGSTGPSGLSSPRPWVVLAAGFTALALDERFAVHERIRDGYLAPRGIRLPLLSWIAPGDFLVLLVAVTGLMTLPLVLRAFTADPAARRMLWLGVALSSVAVGMDSIDPQTWSMQAERVQQTLEECIELAGGLALFGAVTMRLLAVLNHLARLGAEPSSLSELATRNSGTPSERTNHLVSHPPRPRTPPPLRGG